jgi:hypothetical protein
LTLIGQRLRGNLLIRSLIGEGAMGAVFLAENIELPDRRYAVKVLLNPITNAAKFQERFTEEARNQAGLEHPNIVRVHDYFKEDGRYFLVMDYVEGSALSAIIKETGKLKEPRALEIMSDVLRGLDCAHRQGIIHRDVKPSNILVDPSGRARLTDFGIAIRAGEMRLTATGAAAVGTAAYMSPEQIRTPLLIDHRADVYSCGIVLFEMLCGDVPFHGENDFTVQQQQVTARPPDPRILNPEMSRRVARLVLLALAKNPRDRIQGCERFRRMLAGELDIPIRWKRVVPVAAAVLLCIALSASASRWLAWLDRLRPAPPPVPMTGIDDSGRAADAATAALQSFELLCREAAAKLSKEQGKQIAENIPDTARAEKFARQISESQQNIDGFALQYNGSIQKLATVTPPALAQALRNAGLDPMRANYVTAIERHTLQMRAAPRKLEANDLLQLCTSVADTHP